MYEEFAELERAGWSEAARAQAYADRFAQASDQVIAPMIAKAARKGETVLDLCCGQGNLTAALVAQGCGTTGLDFSPAMLELARAKAPEARLVEGDAQALPFPDDGFDAVLCNFGIVHLPDQPKALAEVHRVLKPAGRFAMSGWCGPARSPAMKIVYGAVQAHGSAEVSIPPGPDFHQYDDPAFCETSLGAAGFKAISMTQIASVWELERAEDFPEIYARGTVRAAQLIAAQPEANRQAILAAMRDAVLDDYSQGALYVVPVPSVLITAHA